MKISFTTYIWRDDKLFVAYAPEFDVSSCGKNIQEARKNIEEAVELFLDEAKKMGTLGQILEEAGFEKKQNRWDPPQFISIEKQELAFA